ncbi:cytochrome P450 [Nocardia sp. NPDC005366]|uniref:cytochrome P450 n=1 Tax=Nocardia sp. NPDC005366 TaxID=3156878 RepID=UPI0033B66D76
MKASEVPTFTDHFLVGNGSVEDIAGRFDRLRVENRIVKVDTAQGTYWMVLDYELMRECLQNPAVFSSSSVTPLTPDPEFKMIPINLDPPEHTKWRRKMAPYFALSKIAAMREPLERRAEELINGIKERGGCDYVAAFAHEFPTVVFLELMGLPIENLSTFLEWEAKILLPPRDGVFDSDRPQEGIFAVIGYFTEEVGRRRETGDRPAGLLSDMMDWDIDGEQIPIESLLNCCLILFMAGLDTVADSMSLMMYHLAKVPADRALVARQASESGSVADVVEELLRFHAVAEIGRKITEDIELDGAQLKAGELILFPLVSANRDQTLVDGGEHVDLNRGEPVPHLAFGVGPHRCIGSHLARLEMDIALTTWHRLIPSYELVKEPTGYWGNTHGVYDLELGSFGGA